MALVTLCPGCGTTFRVNAAQLQAHGGEVCCGRCQRVFNGFSTLITVNESEIEYPTQSNDQPEFQSAFESIDASEASSQSNAGIENLNTAMEWPVSSEWDRKEIQTTDGLFDDEKPSNQSRGLWEWASVFLLLVLMGQIAHTYRTELTVIAPEIRPYLERYCAIIACTVPYPQDISLLGIESSELQKNPVRQPEVTTLVATLRNHAPFSQAWPALQLSLLDVDDQLIASRIFTAQDYLQEDNAALPFIEPLHEIEIRLDFDSSQLNALGYRLQLLYL